MQDEEMYLNGEILHGFSLTKIKFVHSSPSYFLGDLPQNTCGYTPLTRTGKNSGRWRGNTVTIAFCSLRQQQIEYNPLTSSGKGTRMPEKERQWSKCRGTQDRVSFWLKYLYMNTENTANKQNEDWNPKGLGNTILWLWQNWTRWVKSTWKGQGTLCLKKHKGEYLGEKQECQKERVAGLC